ncbi:MAG: YCF48-related protein, partial [Patescibacteria group bacterium]
GSDDLHDVALLSSSTIIVVGDNGSIYKTTDGGATWSWKDAATSFDMNAIHAVDSNTIWIAGEGEYLAKSSDGGSTWNQVNFAERNILDEITSIFFESESHGYITRSGGGIWETTDSGVTWTQMDGSSSQIFYALDVASDSVYAANDNGVFVYREEEEPAPSDSYEGELVKTACASGYETNDPCTAVYYVGSDEKRHAFPNEKVYFSWYSDFDDVITISSDDMASYTIGENVTYKPGVTMVKFQSVNTVYAVEEGSILRAVGSESIAASLYGSDWNTNDVDDISDAFYGNYVFGAEINDASDYDVDATLTGTTTIDDNL